MAIFGLSGKYEDYETHQQAYKVFSKSIESIKRKQVEQEFSNGKGDSKKKNSIFKMKKFFQEQQVNNMKIIEDVKKQVQVPQIDVKPQIPEISEGIKETIKETITDSNNEKRKKKKIINNNFSKVYIIYIKTIFILIYIYVKNRGNKAIFGI